MTAAQITWQKDWTGVTVVAVSACPHPGSAAMAIGLAATNTRGRLRISTTATLCMLCGSDTTGRMSSDDVLAAAWDEHGWHRSTGERLLLLAGYEEMA